ncbi:uncharacterized protein LOC124308424 [Neodiprion virginianus]|uniref:uncharacterized protein LOC124308424 n=1 Tax=Neodiprion virginianus TaxID=2961670 RepID=UPI001EE6B38A|nr:uncharacterized protein LOC124308424 [Neodiprion virginianus]
MRFLTAHCVNGGDDHDVKQTAIVPMTRIPKFSPARWDPRKSYRVICGVGFCPTYISHFAGTIHELANRIANKRITFSPSHLAASATEASSAGELNLSDITAVARGSKSGRRGVGRFGTRLDIMQRYVEDEEGEKSSSKSAGTYSIARRLRQVDSPATGRSVRKEEAVRRTYVEKRVLVRRPVASSTAKRCKMVDDSSGCGSPPGDLGLNTPVRCITRLPTAMMTVMEVGCQVGSSMTN